MVDVLMTSALIFVVMVGWLYVQEVYRRFAERHPELGPFRQEGDCDGSCSCSSGSCTAPAPSKAAVTIELKPPAARTNSPKEH